MPLIQSMSFWGVALNAPLFIFLCQPLPTLPFLFEEAPVAGVKLGQAQVNPQLELQAAGAVNFGGL